jgi:hypothetical protein
MQELPYILIFYTNSRIREKKSFNQGFLFCFVFKFSDQVKVVHLNKSNSQVRDLSTTQGKNNSLNCFYYNYSVITITWIQLYQK